MMRDLRSLARAGRNTFVIVALLLLYVGQTISAEINVAVASNFSKAVKEISDRFEAQSGHEIILIFGSTGKHYAQIINGAPYDVFLAADTLRPKLLEQEGLAIPGSRFTYAIGKLMLWSPTSGYVDPEGHVLQQQQFRHLAIANPKLAPYGKAAQQVLQAIGLWQRFQDRIVLGENIGQAFHFVNSGNAELGFIALAQIMHSETGIKGSVWHIPQALYEPVRQQAVLLRQNNAALMFMEFLKRPSVQKIIEDFGYAIP